MKEETAVSTTQLDGLSKFLMCLLDNIDTVLREVLFYNRKVQYNINLFWKQLKYFSRLENISFSVKPTIWKDRRLLVKLN